MGVIAFDQLLTFIQMNVLWTDFVSEIIGSNGH